VGGSILGKSKLTNCSACGSVIASGHKVVCPSCGKVNKKPIYKRVWFIVLIVVLSLGIIGSLLGGDNQVQEPKSNEVNNVASNDSNVKEEKNKNETVSQSNAIEKAKSYLSFTAFSKVGLIKQLEYEGFSNEDSTYGAENAGANWMDQALRSAKSYLNFQAFSKKGLIKQLEFEGYTNEEAVYGVENVGADWMEQAVLKAKDYLKFSSFSRKGLIDQLEFEGFTNEEAVHGVDVVGL
jgi:colicin import membrane protein